MSIWFYSSVVLLSVIHTCNAGCSPVLVWESTTLGNKKTSPIPSLYSLDSSGILNYAAARLSKELVSVMILRVPGLTVETLRKLPKFQKRVELGAKRELLWCVTGFLDGVRLAAKTFKYSWLSFRRSTKIFPTIGTVVQVTLEDATSSDNLDKILDDLYSKISKSIPMMSFLTDTDENVDSRIKGELVFTECNKMETDNKEDFLTTTMYTVCNRHRDGKQRGQIRNQRRINLSTDSLEILEYDSNGLILLDVNALCFGCGYYEILFYFTRTLGEGGGWLERIEYRNTSMFTDNPEKETLKIVSKNIDKVNCLLTPKSNLNESIQYTNKERSITVTVSSNRTKAWCAKTVKKRDLSSIPRLLAGEQDSPDNAENNTKKTKEARNTEFMTLGIFMGLFITFIISSFFAWGLSFIMSIKSGNRFDTPIENLDQ